MLHHTAPLSPARPVPRATIPSPADATAARARLRLAREARDAEAIAECLAVMGRAMSAYAEGRAARIAWLPRHTNPYPTGTPMHAAWNEGWRDSDRILSDLGIKGLEGAP